MTTDPDIVYDRSLLDVETSIGTFPVTAEMIKSFAISTGETNPLFTNEEHAKGTAQGGLVAPPTFCNLFIAGVERPDIKLEFGDTAFFAGQAIDCLALVRPGDTLEATTKLKEVYAKTGRSGKMVFVVWETNFANQRAETVALVRESFVHRKKSPQ